MAAMNWKPIQVYVRNNDLEKAMQVLKKRSNTEGIGKEIRKRKWAMTKSEKRRMKDRLALKRRIRAEAKKQQRKRTKKTQWKMF